MVYHLVCQHYPLFSATSDMGRDVSGWAGCDDYGFCGHSLEFQRFVHSLSPPTTPCTEPCLSARLFAMRSEELRLIIRPPSSPHRQLRIHLIPPLELLCRRGRRQIYALDQTYDSSARDEVPDGRMEGRVAYTRQGGKGQGCLIVAIP